MDFFKSVFSDNLEEEPTDLPSQSPPEIQESEHQKVEEETEDAKAEEDQEALLGETQSNPAPKSSKKSGIWSFGGLVKTLTSKSEFVLENYRHDIEEFTSGLKKETVAIREAASRAVKDLPGTFDAGASVAQEKLESVGRVIDDLGSTVSGIITHGKEVLRSTDQESDEREQANSFSNLSSGKYYNRFESQVRAIQVDVNTYCEDPEDLEEFGKWRMGFVLDEKEGEIRNSLAENESMKGVYVKLVPSEVDEELFWSRYFYKIHILEQVEDARAILVKRAISGEDEEELSWDFDDEEEVDEENGAKKKNVENSQVGETKEKSCDVDEKRADEEESISEGRRSGSSNVVEKAESCSKDSDFSVVSSQPSLPGEEQDLGWDEIEDLSSSSIDEKKVNVGDSPNKTYLRKRLSVAEEEEDLSWDIEDDDQPVKP